MNFRRNIRDKQIRVEKTFLYGYIMGDEISNYLIFD
jgi:hypothetical protein